MLISEHFFVYCGILTVVDISYCMCFILYLFVFCYVFVLCYGPFVCVLNKEYDDDDDTKGIRGNTGRSIPSSAAGLISLDSRKGLRSVSCLVDLDLRSSPLLRTKRIVKLWRET